MDSLAGRRFRVRADSDATVAPMVASEPEYGPLMLALNAKQRGFVEAMYHPDAPTKGDGLLIFAAREAGYGTGTSTNKVLSVIANRLVHDDKVLAAIAEHSKRIVRAISPEAVRAVRNAIADPKHKDHIRAAAMVLDRSDPLETTHTVRVEDDRLPTVEATEQVLKRIEQLMARAGMLPKPAPVIEGECKVINNG